MITRELIEQIEGEASVSFEMKRDKVNFATIAFPHFRGMERILQGKSALDALVITPRVCGICGHAHLMASVRALESAYAHAGHAICLSHKAQTIREFTLVMEMIQNHFKWFYLTLIPELIKLRRTSKNSTPLKGAFAASLASKTLASFAGQWPHSSYMLPGGVTCDPTHMERIKSQGYLKELIHFFETETLGTTLQNFLSFESCKEMNALQSDISYVEQALLASGMHQKGFAYDRFIVLGEHSFSTPSKMKQTRPFLVESKYVRVKESYSPQEQTYAKNALYKNDYYETGPLARAMTAHVPIIRNIHRRFKDSAYSRVMARIVELASLLQHATELLKVVDPTETSLVAPEPIHTITAEGIGIVEAPRGVLMHKVSIVSGVIHRYEIITPTQWNIGSDTKIDPTPVQQAMIDVTKEEALFIFRTFDVCSVCTTH